MARKAAWESASDLGPYAKSGTDWGRVFLFVLLVGMATFVAAYYVPLYRAQQKLAEEYRNLNQKTQTVSDSATKARAELESVKSERDRLRTEQEARKSAKKSEHEKVGKLAADLGVKLDKFVKKGSASIASSESSELVAFDTALVFTPLKLDLSPIGKTLLCEIAKSAAGASLTVSAAMNEEATIPTPLAPSFGNPWSLTAARAAAVAQTLTDKCGFTASELHAVGNGKHDPHASEFAFLKASERIVIELRAH